MGRVAVSRRSFLRLAGLAAASAGLSRAWAAPPGEARAALRIAAAVPVAAPHTLAPSLGGWTRRAVEAFDLLLAPAYLASALIAQGALARLPGPAGRAHDPDGAFTVPGAYRVGALAGGGAALGWEALWSRPEQAVWADEPRLALAAALAHRGYSPNDPHPGRLAQAHADLLALRPRRAADPLGALEAGAASLALALLEPAQAAALPLPAGRALLLEYDWIVPAASPRRAEAAAWARALPPVLPPALDGARLIPLMPLPLAA
jgi:hypothetical protein